MVVKHKRTISFRLATVNDVPKLQTIELAAAAIFSDADLNPHLKNQATSIKAFEESIEQNHCFIITVNDQIAGFCQCGIVDSFWHIFEISIHPDYSRKGFGKQFLNYVVNTASDNQFNAVTLTTFEHIPWNGPFYKKNGFELITENQVLPELRKIIKKEKLIGLKNRIAMKRKLPEYVVRE